MLPPIRDPGIGENAAHKGASDIKCAGDLRFGNASSIEFPDLGRVRSRRCRPTQASAVQQCLSQASSSSFSQNIPFELCEYGQQASQGLLARGTRENSLTDPAVTIHYDECQDRH
jgi:hypothetical protein